MGIVMYLIIGTVFTLVVDIACNLVGAKTFNTLERIMCIIFWPITMPLFIISFVREYFKKNKDD
tara:strand:+ start:298 stop:489 length:192 start_codon:yes stop_codon:yes gene_type:complete